MKRHINKILVVALAILVCSAFVQAVADTRAQRQEAKELENSPQEYCKTGMIRSAAHLTQVVTSANESGADGHVVSFKKMGDKVVKGQELIDCEYLKGKQIELGAVLEKSRVQELLAKEALHKAMREKERHEVLFVQGALAQSAWQNTLSAFTKADLEVKMAQQDVVAAEQRSSPYNFAAQMDGEVIAVSSQLRMGFVITKYQRPIDLMAIANLSQLEVTVEIPYQQIHRIDSFSVVCLADAERKKLPAQRTGMEEKDGKLYMTVSFENADGQFRPFEAAQVVVSFKKNK